MNFGEADACAGDQAPPENGDEVTTRRSGSVISWFFGSTRFLASNHQSV